MFTIEDKAQKAQKNFGAFLASSEDEFGILVLWKPGNAETRK